MSKSGEWELRLIAAVLDMSGDWEMCQCYGYVDDLCPHQRVKAALLALGVWPPKKPGTLADVRELRRKLWGRGDRES